MAASLDNIQKLIDEINKTLKSSQGKITADAREYVKQFKDVDAAAKSLELTMRGIRQTQLETNTGLNDLRERFNDIGKELNKQDFIYKSMYKSFSKIVSYADDLSDIQYDLASSSLKETKGLQNKVNLEFNRLKNQAKYLEQQIDSDKLQGKELEKARELFNFARDKVKALEEQVGYQDQFNKSLNETYKRQQRVHNAVGITGKLIGGLGSLLEKVGFDDFGEEIKNAKDQMGNLAIQITNNGEKAAGFVGTMKVGLAGLKSLGKSVAMALSDPLVVFTILYKTIKSLIGLVSDFAKGASNVGKAFGIAGKNAEETYMTIQKSQDLYHFPDELLEGQKKYNEAVGFNLTYNKENAALMQDLTHYLGLSDEQAGKLVRRSRILGQDFNAMDKDMAGVTSNFNKQNKTAVPYAKVLDQISKVSASTAFNIKGGTKGLAEAAANAARYGREMDDINNSAMQLLNFEDSISNEIEAELLTGKDLNLEKLRYAALTGDVTTQAKEQERLVRENFKNLKGNRLAQDAFAKSVGMTTDEVAKMVEQQQIEADILKKEGVAGLQRHQDEIKAQAKQAKEAEATDRAFKSAVMQLKTALLPLIQKITPFFITMAESMTSIAKALSGGVGKTILAIIGGAGALYAGSKIVKGIGGLFSGGMGIGKAGDMMGGDKPGTAKTGFLGKVLGIGGGKIGSSASNPMYVYVVNQGGGGGGTGEGEGGGLSDKVEDILKGSRSAKGLKAFKGLSKLFGGKKTMIGRGLRNVAAMMGKNEGIGSQLLKGFSNSKVGTAVTSMGSKLGFGGAQAAEGAGNFLSKSWGGVKGFVGKAGETVGKSLGGVKNILGSPIAKGFGKALGPIFAAISSISEVSSVISGARAQKAKGEKIDMGSLGKKIVQAGAYPIANLATNLIPGVGTAISISDGILGAFGMSPIKWITDNLVSLVPNEAFTGLGRLALGEKAMAAGGIVTGPTRALVGEAGPEAVIPLSQLMNEFKEMKQILRAILHKEGTITLNGTKMGTAMAVGSYKVQ